MTVYTKPLDDPELLAQLKSEGKTVLEVHATQYFIIDGLQGMKLEDILRDWFVRHKGCSHAWRDGSHVGGGADTVSEVKVLTEEGRVIYIPRLAERRLPDLERGEFDDTDGR